jgi:hypothetical protein
MAAPYQLPADLQAQPLGISWTTLGGGTTLKPTPAENAAAMTSIAWQASGEADGEAGQTLRASLATETNYAPSHRVGIWPNGLARFIASQNPVLRVVQAQVAPAGQLPNQVWTALPIGNAYPEEEAYGIYNSTAPGGAHGGGQGILLSGCYVNWGLGRKGIRVQVSYLAGWPHTVLTANASSDDMSIQVDDVTAWSGAIGWISDGGQTEVVACGIASSSGAPAYNPAANYPPGAFVSLSGANYACLITNGPGTVNGVQSPPSSTNTAFWAANPEPAGPGTLELLTPIRNPHSAPVLVTTIPPQVRWAVALYAKAQALERGVATMAIPSGGTQSGGGLSGAIASARIDAAIIIRDFCRPF